MSPIARVYAHARTRPVLGQFFRFAAVGSLNAGIFFGSYNVFLHLGWAAPAAYAVAFLLGSVNSFLLNKYFTFRDRRRGLARQYVVFVAFTLVGLLLSEAALLAVLQPLEGLGTLGRNLAALTVAPVGVLWNFTVYRRWTFMPHAPH